MEYSILNYDLVIFSLSTIQIILGDIPTQHSPFIINPISRVKFRGESHSKSMVSDPHLSSSENIARLLSISSILFDPGMVLFAYEFSGMKSASSMEVSSHGDAQKKYPYFKRVFHGFPYEPSSSWGTTQFQESSKIITWPWSIGASFRLGFHHQWSTWLTNRTSKSSPTFKWWNNMVVVFSPSESSQICGRLKVEWWVKPQKQVSSQSMVFNNGETLGGELPANRKWGPQPWLFQ